MSEVDPRELAREKFASGDGMEPAIAWLGEHATDAPLAVGALIDALAPAAVPGSRVCELGFGSGWLLEDMDRAFPDVSIAGLDMSLAMVSRARERFAQTFELCCGEMEHLPFRDAAFDAIVTCWTLYFMRDIDAALAGFKRCLKPGGRFLTATVAPDHMLEFDELHAEAVHRALGREPSPDVGARFDLRSGAAYMRRTFAEVELRQWYGEIILPDRQTGLELWDIYGSPGLAAAEAALVREEFGRLAGARFREDGPIRVRRHDGLFVGQI